jgi:RNA polymerase sigma-70 factor (ECF subfamily)
MTLVTSAVTPVVAGYDALHTAVVAVRRLEVMLAASSMADGDADGHENSLRLPGSASSPSHGSTDGRGSGLRPPSDEAQSLRLSALVDLARQGDAEAFGQLYDHYLPSVYRFIYYRVSGAALAEDLTSETFFRALRSITTFTWQGKDFGAWLMTIARNIVVDHHKSARTRLESPTAEFIDRQETAANPEERVVEELTHDVLRATLSELPAEQQECLVLRFLEGFSINETARVLEKSEGAVKQLQLRALRSLARRLPEGLR